MEVLTVRNTFKPTLNTVPKKMVKESVEIVLRLAILYKILIT